MENDTTKQAIGAPFDDFDGEVRVTSKKKQNPDAATKRTFSDEEKAKLRTIDPTITPLWELFPDLCINPFEKLEPVQSWLRIGGRDAIPKEGLISFSAKQKQGKSYAVLALLIPILTGRVFDTAVPTGEPPRLAWLFDTEMGRYSITNRAKMTQNDMGKQGRRLPFTSLKGLDIDEMKARVQEVIDVFDPKILVFDQVGDLVTDILKSDQGKEVARWLDNLSQGRTVLAVIHTNKNDDNETGHLGSELTKKVVEAYTVEKDATTGIFHVSIKFARDTDTVNPESVSFVVQDGAIRTGADVVEAANAKVRKELSDLLVTAFNGCTELNNGVIKKNLMSEAIMGSGNNLTDATAERKLETAKKLGVLQKINSAHLAPFRLVIDPQKP